MRKRSTAERDRSPVPSRGRNCSSSRWVWWRLTVAVLQTAVVPVLGIIAHQLNASPVAVSWAVTANLLAAAASTPLIGRLADLHNKKHVLLGVLVIVLVGSVLAATTSSLALLIVARVLQGVSFSLYPICVAILRDELPEGAVVRALAVLSGTLGFGGGTGLVVTGLLMNGDAGYHRVFWLTTGFTLAVIVMAVAGGPVTPEKRRRNHRLAGRSRPGHWAVGRPADHHAGQLVGLDGAGDPRSRGLRCGGAGRMVGLGAAAAPSVGLHRDADPTRRCC